MNATGWNLPPNWLTFGRIVLTPLIGLALARGDYGRAFPMLFVAGISDALDGWLARRFHWQSRLGERLDPLADKFMVGVVYLGLGAGGGLPWWLVGLVLGRDVAILAAAGVLLGRERTRRFPPSVWGKTSTVFQMLLGGLSVLAGAYPGLGVGLVLPALVVLTAVFTGVSGLHYAWRMAAGD